MEKVSTRPVAVTSVQESVGRKHRSQNFRGGTSVRSHAVHTRRDDARVAQPFQERAHRLAGVPVVGEVELVLLDRARRARGTAASHSAVARGANGGVTSRVAVAPDRRPCP